MQVLGESLIVDSMQYVHLGYLSVTIPDPPVGNAQSFGIGGLVVFFAGVLTARKYWHRSVAVRATGITLALLGFASLVSLTCFWQVLGWQKYKYPGTITSMYADTTAYGIHEYRMQHLYGQAPTGMPMWKPGDKPYKDGWKRDMRIGRVFADGHIFYSQISAGEDGKFNTKDDYFCGVDDAGNALRKFGETIEWSDAAGKQPLAYLVHPVSYKMDFDSESIYAKS